MPKLAMNAGQANARLDQLNFHLSRETCQGFLQAFVRETAELFDADHFFIARNLSTGHRLRTLHASANGELVSNYAFDGQGTPCEEVLRTRLCVYEDNVGKLFPDDFMLEEMGIRAWVGMPLLHGAQAVGIVVAMFRRPLKNADELVGVLNHYKRRLTTDMLTDEVHERAELAIKGTSDGIWDWCLQTDQMYLSARCRELLGYEPRDITEPSDRMLTLIHLDDRVRLSAALKAHQEAGRPFDLSVRLKVVGGNSRWFRIRGDAVRDGEGTAFRMVGALTDIHDLVEARQQATEASRAKSKFLATMSHEIRTPLNGVLGMSSLLASTELEDSQRDMVKLIEESGHALLDILNDILDLANIESGRFEVESASYNPSDLLQSVLGPYRLKAAENGLNLNVEIDPCAHTTIEGDPARIRQILSNLISNAVKFTERGEIRVRCLTHQLPDGQHEMRYEIADTGIGMDEELVARVFMPFSQGEAVLARKHGGTGLGLAIAKKLAELMDGDIAVESAPGSGSLFTLTLPAAQPVDLAGKAASG